MNVSEKGWRIAVVVQRYGEEVNGGAEMHARWMAERLQALGEVQVITTCAVDFTTWANVYPPGESELNGVRVHRFLVDAERDWHKAQQETGRFFHTSPTPFEELEWIKQQGPYSTDLLAHLRKVYEQVDVFFFFTYLYATTYFGLPLVSDKAILIPEAHDEPYLYMSAFRSLFHLPQAIVYNTEYTRQLVQRVMHNERIPNMVAGLGIEMPPPTDVDRFRAHFGVADPFLFYVGRIHPGKNVGELFEHFLRFRAAEPERPLKFLLAGKSHMTIPNHPDIIHLGFISEQEKFDGMAASAVVVNPSLYESLSIIALEGWLVERPFLANGRCDLLKHQCRQSNGGLYYSSYAEFEAALRRLLDNSELRRALGENGRQFTQKRYDWRVILAKYRALFQTVFPLPTFPQ